MEYFLIFGFVIFFVLLLAFIWSRAFKRAVAIKTRALSEKAKWLEGIIEGNPIPTFIVDKNRKVNYWNKACEALTGQPAAKIVGTNQYAKALYGSRSYSIVDLLFDNVLHKRIQIHDSIKYTRSSMFEGAYETELFFNNLGDDGKWLYGTAALLKDEKQNIIGAIETWQDLTGYKQLEKQLIQSQKMEAMGTLAGGVAHDFNNILLAVIGHADVALLHLSKESPARRSIDQIISAGLRARDLISQILTFSRRADFEAKPVQVSTITKETIKLFNVSLPGNIKFIEDILSDARVMADETQVHQIILNLCTNACQAMANDGGTLTIRLSEVALNEDNPALEPDCIPGQYIKLSVVDTGHGIEPEIHEKIFEPFFTTRKKGEGTGMGLSVIHGIIKKYGGMIQCESEMGKGATFNVFLPMVTASAHEKGDTSKG